MRDGMICNFVSFGIPLLDKKRISIKRLRKEGSFSRASTRILSVFKQSWILKKGPTICSCHDVRLKGIVKGENEELGRVNWR
jgi:hypothetical protein